MNSVETRIARRALIDTVQLGNLISMNGNLRVVREVHIHPKKKWVQSLTLAIMRCSWTRQPYTVYNRYDLSAKPFEILDRGNWIRDGWFEKLLMKQIQNNHSQKILECCDVIGVIR